MRKKRKGLPLSLPFATAKRRRNHPLSPAENHFRERKHRKVVIVRTVVLLRLLLPNVLCRILRLGPRKGGKGLIASFPPPPLLTTAVFFFLSLPFLLLFFFVTSSSSASRLCRRGGKGGRRLETQVGIQPRLRKIGERNAILFIYIPRELSKRQTKISYN